MKSSPLTKIIGIIHLIMTQQADFMASRDQQRRTTST